MFKTLKDRFGTQFLKSEGKGFAANVKLSDYITVTTSNPATFERLTGEKVDKSPPKRTQRKWQKPGTARAAHA